MIGTHKTQGVLVPLGSVNTNYTLKFVSRVSLAVAQYFFFLEGFQRLRYGYWHIWETLFSPKSARRWNRYYRTNMANYTTKSGSIYKRDQWDCMVLCIVGFALLPAFFLENLYFDRLHSGSLLYETTTKGFVQKTLPIVCSSSFIGLACNNSYNIKRLCQFFSYIC